MSTQVGSYRFTSAIGEGNFGRVFECINILTGDIFACKVIDRTQLMDSTSIKNFKNELRNQAKANHPSVIQLVDVCIDDDYVYLFIEHCDNGSLGTLVDIQGEIEKEYAKIYFRDVLSGLSHIHGLNISHRDIKLHNILLTSDDRAKIADFGFSTPFYQNFKHRTVCGTAPYMAPEMFEDQGYDSTKADMWAAGICLYTMVHSHFPWTQDPNLTENEQIESIQKQILSSEIVLMPNLPTDLEDLIMCLLDRNPETRYSAEEALDHPWIVNDDGNEGYGYYEDETYSNPSILDLVENTLSILEARMSPLQ